MSKQIELSWGFGELRKNLEEFEDMEKWKANGEIERQAGIGNQLPAIQENGGDSGKAFFLRNGENGGDQIPSLTQQGEMVKVRGLLSQEWGR